MVAYPFESYYDTVLKFDVEDWLSGRSSTGAASISPSFNVGLNITRAAPKDTKAANI